MRLKKILIKVTSYLLVAVIAALLMGNYIMHHVEVTVSSDYVYTVIFDNEWAFHYNHIEDTPR